MPSQIEHLQHTKNAERHLLNNNLSVSDRALWQGAVNLYAEMIALQIIKDKEFEARRAAIALVSGQSVRESDVSKIFASFGLSYP